MSSELKLDVGQAVELKDAFRRTRGSNGAEWTNEDIKKLSEGDHLGLVLDYLQGRSNFVPAVQVNEDVAVATNKFLRLISGGKQLMLDEVDGTEILAEAKDVFSWIDSDFINYGADEKGQATAETPVNVHEMMQDGTFAQLFDSLNADLDKLCFTQHQIKNFVLKHRSQLRTEGYGTFFLFKSKGKFFVADVYLYSDGALGVIVGEFAIGYVWRAESRRRFVVPHLAEI